MKFVFPENGLWILLMPVSIGIIYLVYRRVKGITNSWFDPKEIRWNFPQLKFWLRFFALILTLISLTGPYLSEGEQEVDVLGREIYLLLDVSSSMNATDIKPSRLEKAKRELKILIEALKGDRIGLIVFTDYAYVQCPLTSDYQMLITFLDLVKTDQFNQTGTQYRNALAASLDRLVNMDANGQAVNKGLVLISDGGDFGDTYTSIIDRLKQKQIKLYPVGIGSYEGTTIPSDPLFPQGAKMRDEDGAPVISYLIDEPLKLMAREFGTKYLTISESYMGLDALEKQLMKLDASPYATQLQLVEKNQYRLFLLPACICLFISLIIMPIKKK